MVIVKQVKKKGTAGGAKPAATVGPKLPDPLEKVPEAPKAKSNPPKAKTEPKKKEPEPAAKEEKKPVEESGKKRLGVLGVIEGTLFFGGTGVLPSVALCLSDWIRDQGSVTLGAAIATVLAVSAAATVSLFKGPKGESSSDSEGGTSS